ncbi:phage gp6-like head-tail connector protein [Salmonella enterica subsp. enterica serovar Senftenberg]|nr:phage gp6-like head-tail connector protein [Salmonella enterica subsp. enterica serovar Uganda]EBB7557832.1 phage gp6-like head-tail connector protein [Salmonella enterica subsp. enterica serovar Senftenberg]ECH3269916.1 phage gp6-like head-tail connector protein [Salmonella enterica]ECV9767209.1 phage gp6-like head-tail connector protein [Salmonella enterica subsp. enterica serovar Senftenberg]EFL6959429.1 phage gp6-like head-tail connector protein [Salmonella enterica subsp. enterica serov
MLELVVVKQHCRIDTDFSGDDDLLTLYSGAAARYVETWTRRTLYEAEDSPGYSDDPDSILLNDDVKAAMLLLIGQWYANREAVNIGNITSEIPFAVEALLQPYRIYGL